MKTGQFEGWLKEHLVCPYDHNNLIQLNDDTLICSAGHRYPIIEDIPIMLLQEEVLMQEDIFSDTLKFVKSYPLSQYINPPFNDFNSTPSAVDSYVTKVISATCGMMYRNLINKLERYPIPILALPPGNGKCFLDIGCNWGRWCISAAKLGYRAVGIDHNLEAIRAALRVSRQLGISSKYLVADARHIPFKPSAFDIVFSYSTFQHFNKDNLRLSIAEIARTLKTSGISLIQMANIFGSRNFYNQLKRGFNKPIDFEVRYWSPYKLIETFSKFIGPTSLLVDSFFSLNAQTTDKDLMPFQYRIVINFSDMLRKMSEKNKWLKYYADSLYVKSLKIEDK